MIHYTIRGAVCFQFTHFLVMAERIYILCLMIIIKSEVWTFTHCLGLGHETMVWAVCLFVFFFFLIKIIRLEITVKTYCPIWYNTQWVPLFQTRYIDWYLEYFLQNLHQLNVIRLWFHQCRNSTTPFGDTNLSKYNGDHKQKCYKLNPIHPPVNI